MIKDKSTPPALGYKKITPDIPINTICCISVTTGGLVKIDNMSFIDSQHRCFFETEIFYSEEKERFIVTSFFKNCYSESMILNLIRKSKNKVTKDDMFNILDIDLTRTEPPNFPVLPGYYTAKKQFRRSWDCPNYIIIGR